MLCAALLVALMPNQYESKALLAPPDQPTSYASLLGPTAGIAAVGGLLGTKSSGQQNIIGILQTRTAQDEIIDRLDLRRAYHKNLYIDARSILTRKTAMVEDRLTGFVSITVTDTDPKRARDIAQAYVDELNKLLNSQRNSSAHQERVFLEKRLDSLKVDLDSSSKALSSFSSRSATINPQSQGTALVDAAAKLQSELISAQSELYALKAQYTDDNLRVRTAQARVADLEGALNKMENSSESAANHSSEAGFPSLRDLPALGVTYTSLARTVALQEGVYETLTKEYELAKVQEAKDTPAVRVLDLPVVAERKSGPHRLYIVLEVTLIAAFLATILGILLQLWDLILDSNPFKSFLRSIYHAVRNTIVSRQAGNIRPT